MRWVLPGGTGQVGTLLARELHAAGHDVTVLSRAPRSAPWRVLAWDGVTPGGWAQSLEDADIVVNLAGRSVNCRYGPANRREIMDSRVHSTRVVGETIARCATPPRAWLQMSTATIYAHRFDAPNDEATGILGGDEPDVPDTWRFSIDVAQSWERALAEVATPATRKVALRSAIVMNADPGSPFAILRRLSRLGLGGRSGDGRQYVSWIHEADFVRAVRFVAEHDALTGPVNLASPNPLPNSGFMRALREACGAPFGLPAERWMLEIGAIFLRTETELLLKSRRAVPTRLLEHGFHFDHPSWPDAARDLCARWDARSGASSRR